VPSPWTMRRMMFIAMNRFRVKKGSEEAFEQVWLSRDTQLTKVPGFVEFHLLNGPEHEEYTLIPHTQYGRAR
jgi:heme-degrading monooxygenase HmoA